MNGPIDTPEEQWLSSRNPEQTRWKYINSIGEFKSSVKIVTGEANGKLFDRTELADALSNGLRENRNATVRFVFHKNEDKDTARQSFETENTHIMAVKRVFSERVHLYWVPLRPEQHYAVIDDETVILEQPNHRGGEPFWGKIVKDSNIALEWENRFDEYVKYCVELPFAVSPVQS